MKKGALGLLGVLALVALVVFAGKARDIYEGSLEARVDALASIQPGLGTVMIEYGNRFTNMYFAAQGGNWALAQYQLKEAIEIQEVGEVTRPGKAAMLSTFEHTYLDPLKAAIEAQDWNAFETRFEEAVAGCNACHAATGHPYIEYTLPERPTEAYLNFNLKTSPTRALEEEEEGE